MCLIQMFLWDSLESRPQDYVLCWGRKVKKMVVMKTEGLSIAHTLVISGISSFSNDLHFKNLNIFYVELKDFPQIL